MFITGVNWQLSEMGTASHMFIAVSGNCGMRQVAPQHLLQRYSTGRSSFIAHDLFVLPSPRFRLVFFCYHFDKKLYRAREGRHLKQHSAELEVSMG